MRKVLYLSDVDISDPGGAQSSMKVIMTGLNEKYDFSIITPKIKRREISYDFNTLELRKFDNLTLAKMNTFSKIRVLKNIHKIIKINNPDIIHVQMPSTMIIIFILKRLKLICKNIKIYYTDRGVLDKYGFLTQYIIGKNIKYGYFEKIICTTEYNKKLYLKKFINQQKVIVIPNTTGTDFENKIGDHFIYNENKIRILFAGRWSIDKNWALTKEIIEYLYRKKEISRINIVIGYDVNDLSTAKEIKNYEESLISVNKNVEINFYYNLKEREIATKYLDNDIFILSSSKESFGRTAIEAMALNNIVFGTKVDGLKEVIGFDEYLYSDFADFKIKFEKFQEKLIHKEIEKIKLKFKNRYFETYSVKRNLLGYDGLYTI